MPLTTAQPRKLWSLCVGLHSNPVKDSTDNQLSFVFALASLASTYSDFFWLELWKPHMHSQYSATWPYSSHMFWTIFLFSRWRCQQVQEAWRRLVTVSALALGRGGAGEVWGSNGSFWACLRSISSMSSTPWPAWWRRDWQQPPKTPLTARLWWVQLSGGNRAAHRHFASVFWKVFRITVMSVQWYHSTFKRKNLETVVIYRTEETELNF